MSHKNWQHVETLTGQKEKVSSCQFGCYKYQLDWGKFGHQLHVYLWARLTLHSGFGDDCKGLWKFSNVIWQYQHILVSAFYCQFHFFSISHNYTKKQTFWVFFSLRLLTWTRSEPLIFATGMTFLINNQFQLIFHHFIWIGPLPPWKKGWQINSLIMFLGPSI